MKRCRSPREITHYRGVSKCLEGWRAVLHDTRTGLAAQSPAFGSERDAAVAYDRMALELFDTQAVLNFVNGKVNYQAKLAHQDWTFAPRITPDLAAHLQKCAALVPLVRQRSSSSTASAPSSTSTSTSRGAKRRRSPTRKPTTRRSQRLKDEISEDDDGYNSSASVEAAFQELVTQTSKARSTLVTGMEVDVPRGRRTRSRLRLPHKLAEEVRRRRCGTFSSLQGIETPPPGSPEQRRSRVPSTPLLRMRPIGSVDALCRHMTALLASFKGRPDEPHYFHALFQLTARNPAAEGFVLAAGQVLDMALEVGKTHCAEALIASIREGHWAEIGKQMDVATMHAMAAQRKRFQGTELEGAYDKAFTLAAKNIPFVGGYLLALKALLGLESPAFAASFVEAIKEGWIRA